MPRWVTRAAGGWGFPPPGIRRPPVAPMHQFTRRVRVQIRPGEGTVTGLIPASGTVKLAIGPAALITWYVTYVSIQTTTGALDTSTCSVQVGPATNGINPAGQSYAGGGDTISLGGRALTPGEYITLIWSRAKQGDLAIATVYGDQEVPA